MVLSALRGTDGIRRVGRQESLQILEVAEDQAQMGIRGKHKRILDRILTPGTRTDIRWSEFVALVEHLGGTVKARKGSTRVAELNDVRIAFHEPHGTSGAVIKAGMLKRARQFLTKAGADSK